MKQWYESLFENYGNNTNINCDRDAQGDVYFADVCLSIVRPKCLEDLDYGILPQKWMGQKIYGIKQEGGLDVDYDFQMPQIEFWLKKQGFTKDNLPYEKKRKD